MNSNGIKSKLRALAELQTRLAELKAEQEQVIDSLLTPEQRTSIADVRAEYADKLRACSEAIQEEDVEIRAAVLKFGKSVEGDILSAVFVPGRDRWDPAKLEGYAAAHPEINKFRTKGKPSVQIRERRGKDNATHSQEPNV